MFQATSLQENCPIQKVGDYTYLVHQSRARVSFVVLFDKTAADAGYSLSSILPEFVFL